MTALELTALALVSRLLSKDDPLPTPRLAVWHDEPTCHPEGSLRQGSGRASDAEASRRDDAAEDAMLRQAQDDTVAAQRDTVAAHHDTIEHFFTSDAGSDPRYYRAYDESGEVLAAFYADGRVRLADDVYRLVGIVQTGRADLLNIADNSWSELFVRATPEGRLLLQLRGAPYDMRVLTCEPLTEFRMTTS